MKRIFFLLMAVLLCTTAISQTKTVRLEVDVGSESIFTMADANTTISFNVPAVDYNQPKQEVFMFEPVSKSDPFADAMKMERNDVVFKMHNQQLLNPNEQQKNPNAGYNFINEEPTRLDIGEFTW